MKKTLTALAVASLASATQTKQQARKLQTGALF